MHQYCKFGDTSQKNIISTNFRTHPRTDIQTDGQPKNMMPPVPITVVEA